MSLVHNEQTKLTAGAFDRVSTACLALGVIAPVAAWTFGAPGYFIGPTLIGFTAAWCAFGVGIHLVARALLRNLKP